MAQTALSKESIIELISILVNDSDTYSYHESLLTNNVEMLETLFDNYFTKIEGHSCSHDKSAYVVNKMLRSLKTKENYQLQETYDIVKYPQMKNHEGEIAYWCPKTVSDTAQAIAFVESVLTLDFENIAACYNRLHDKKSNEELNKMPRN